jgi:hypothetical protein
MSPMLMSRVTPMEPYFVTSESTHEAAIIKKRKNGGRG